MDYSFIYHIWMCMYMHAFRYASIRVVALDEGFATLANLGLFDELRVTLDSWLLARVPTVHLEGRRAGEWGGERARA